MIAEQTKTRIAVNGYGVIGKRVADAVARQDMHKPTCDEKRNPARPVCNRRFGSTMTNPRR